MSIVSSIEWTDATWNPVRGCTKISPGCAHCYAHTFAERFRGVPGHPYEQGFDLRVVPEKVTEPLKWGNPRRIFVNSMSDLFHEEVPDYLISRVGEVMKAAPWHTFQLLTKRPERLARSTRSVLAQCKDCRNIWWGVSVENRKHGVPRIATLQETDVPNRFLSIEPLLEDIGQIDLSGIGWVIVGGESGHGARAIHESWVRSLRDQCYAYGVPYFFKQWGGVNKKRWGRSLDGQTHDQMPECPAVEVPALSLRRRMIQEIELRWQSSDNFGCDANLVSRAGMTVG